ncbi:MAG: winged helix-turn-helix transcriptional regulator [Acidimicrobiaceae bacterium]|nr:winged helix-turn-helix transcriptional regulator [Acidimicrobiaceae bacterium]
MSISTEPDISLVFADPLRREILDLLADEQLCTCHLVELTGAKQPTISHHLKVLKQFGIVESEAVGRNTYYRIVSSSLIDYANSLISLAKKASYSQKERLGCQ